MEKNGKKELMKLPKKFIINMYRNVCFKYQDKEQEFKELEKVYEQACDAAGALQERARDAESEIRNILNDIER